MKTPPEDHDLIRWLDGEMDVAERTAFERRLESDAALRAEAQELQRLSAADVRWPYVVSRARHRAVTGEDRRRVAGEPPHEPGIRADPGRLVASGGQFGRDGGRRVDVPDQWRDHEQEPHYAAPSAQAGSCSSIQASRSLRTAWWRWTRTE